MSRDDATSCSVLLIDDDSIAEEIVAHCLANCAGAVTCYDSRPARAVELAVEVNATVVLVNLRMPVLDGFDVVRLLRADPATEHIPIIVLSSEDHPSSGPGPSLPGPTIT